ncbi:MAG: hypothetical protein ISQ11_10935 [Planctomycetes bacterium]|nr:hypothetical protein [Planctomycetota bacterium]
MTDASAAFDRLAEARRVMESGLALLDGASVEDADVPAALGRIAAVVSEAGAYPAMREGIPAAELERFDDELEDLLRLNAVLTAAVKQDREALTQRLKATRESRRDLARQAPDVSEGSGGRCDVSG